MALECLCSDEIIGNEEDCSRKEFKRVPEANYFRVQKCRLLQYRANPGPNKKMFELMEEAKRIEISAERHAGNVSYTIDMIDFGGKNLKTYYL